MPHFLGVEEAMHLSRQEVRELYRNHVNPGLAQMLSLLDFDKRFVRAEGVCVWDDQGQEYLDFLGAYGALNLGHNPPDVMAAMAQVQRVPNLLQASLGALPAALAHNLAQVAPGKLSRCFFGNSGAEAVEGALKLARAASRKAKIIYCEGSFHGKTMGALSVTGRDKYKKPFQPLLPEVAAIPYGDSRSLERALAGKDVAAFIVEPVQGEGGIIVPPPGYLREARELCRQYGAYFIADEIQTGLGRTGRLFACEHEGVEPDIMCLAKSLGGGMMPIGVFMTTPEIWDKAFGGLDKALLHTSTFGGNAIAAAAGIAALAAIVEDGLAEAAAAKGRYLIEALQNLTAEFPLLKEVRGQGLMIGIEFQETTAGTLDKLTGGRLGQLSHEYLGSLVAGELLNKHRIITAYTLNNPNVIRLEPPLTVTYEQLDTAIGALKQVFQSHGGFFSVALASGRTIVSSFLRK